MSRPHGLIPLNKKTKKQIIDDINWLSGRYNIPINNIKGATKAQLIAKVKFFENNPNRRGILDKEIYAKEHKFMKLNNNSILNTITRLRTTKRYHEEHNARTFEINKIYHSNNIENTNSPIFRDIRPIVARYSQKDFITITLWARDVDDNPVSFQTHGVLISQFNIIAQEIVEWAISVSQSNRYVEVERIEINVVKANAGGCCDNRHDKIYKIHGFKMIDYYSQHNNCFFRCIKDELGWELISRAKCNEARALFNLEEDSKISIEQAMTIFNHYCQNKYLTIYDGEMNELQHNGEYDETKTYAQLRLQDGHYTRILTKIVQKKKCSKCFKEYVNKHVCNQARLSFLAVKKHKQKVLLDNMKNEELNTECVVHYDIETHAKNTLKKHTAYIVGYSHGNEFRYIKGIDCMEKFVKLMFKLYKDGKEMTYLNAFNGRNFDHHFFIEAALKLGYKTDEYMAQNGSSIRIRYGKLQLIDVAQHTGGTLKDNLKSYNCKIQKGDFDHTRGNYWNQMSSKDRKDCITYLKSDVMGMKEFYEILNKAVHERHNVNIHKYVSTSQLTFSAWKREVCKAKHLISLPTLQQEKVFRSGCYGARCYKCKTYFEAQEDEYLLDEDVISLYPSAMERYEYPIGFPIEMSEKQIGYFNGMINKFKKIPYMGYYYIKYETNKYLAHAVLPKKTKLGLKWDLLDGEGYYNSVDIDNALEEGYKIQIMKPEEGQIGYYWTKTAPIFKSYINKLYIDKQKAKKGTPAYNVAKLFMTGMYGKMIQRPIATKQKWIKSNGEFWKFYGKYKITSMKFIEKQLYLSGISRDEAELEKSITKPTYLGGFILAYSRRIMLEYFKKSNPYFNIKNMPGNLDELINKQIDNDYYYTDTDSIHVHEKNKIPFNKDVLGCLDDDLDGGRIKRAIYISPKLYMLEYEKDGKMHYHFRGKGIDVSKLNEDKFVRMLNGESIKMERDFQMKKVGTKKTSKQANISEFSILHLTGDVVARVINKDKWSGRVFDSTGNKSLPYGHVGVLMLKDNSKNIEDGNN
jgi:hypothetical protein